MKLNKNHKEVLAVCLIMAIELTVLLCTRSYGTSPDTISYFNTWTDNLVHFRIDISRTPVYPLLMGIMGSIFGKAKIYIGMAVMQSVVAVISIPYFYQTARYVLKLSSAALIITFFYATYPAFLWWNHMVLTESFAMSGSIFMVYCLLSAFYKKSIRYSIYASLWLIFLLFLRPAFIYMLPVLVVCSLILLLKKEREKIAIALLAGVALTTMLLLGYMTEFKKEYGFWGFTRISVTNRYFIARENGILDSNMTSDKSLSQLIERNYKKNGAYKYYGEDLAKIWQEWRYIRQHYDSPTIEEVVDQSIRANKIRYARAIMGNLKRCVEEQFFDDSFSFTCTSPFRINFYNGWIVLVLFLYLLYTVYMIWRRCCMPWPEILLLLLGLSGFIVVFVGSMAEYCRLLMPSKFIYLLMMAQLAVEARKTLCSFQTKRVR